MCNKECVPAVYKTGKKKGQYAINDYGRMLARKELENRDGPCPPDKDLCRHLCENDSSSPNGFVCILHTVWGTRSENELDKPEEVRKRAASAAGKSGGKIGGKVSGRKSVESGHLKKVSSKGGKSSSAIERTCPHCGRIIRGPGYFQHERACQRRLQVSLLPNDAGR